MQVVYCIASISLDGVVVVVDDDDTIYIRYNAIFIRVDTTRGIYKFILLLLLWNRICTLNDNVDLHLLGV